jgi:hypothetical protein
VKQAKQDTRLTSEELTYSHGINLIENPFGFKSANNGKVQL